MRGLPLIDCCAPLGAWTLSDAEAHASAALFAALADPARVRIVNFVATSDDPVCACHLIEPLGLSQAGLLDREQRGKWAYFSLTPEASTRLAGLVDLARDREEALR